MVRRGKYSFYEMDQNYLPRDSYMPSPNGKFFTKERLGTAGNAIDRLEIAPAHPKCALYPLLPVASQPFQRDGIAPC
jgi:hypothetical protein